MDTILIFDRLDRLGKNVTAIKRLFDFLRETCGLHREYREATLQTDFLRTIPHSAQRQNDFLWKRKFEQLASTEQ